MKKYILWDNDGVLVDTEKYYLKANQIVLGELDIELTEDAYKRISLSEGKSVLELSREKGFNDEMILQLRDKRDDVYEKFILHENLALPDVETVLSGLKGKFGMGVVTSTKSAYFKRLHELTGFHHFFDFVVAREEYKIAKPDPEPYMIGIEKSGCVPSEVVAVEDTPRGVRSAVKAGIDCIAIPNQFTHDAEFEGAVLRLESIAELNEDLLLKL